MGKIWTFASRLAAGPAKAAAWALAGVALTAGAASAPWGSAFFDTANGRVGINTASPTANLDVDGTVRLRAAGTPASGKVLTASDANGNAAWQTPGSARLQWVDATGRIGVDGGTNNAAVAYADTAGVASTVNTGNLRKLYLRLDGAITTDASSSNTIVQSATVKSCRGLPSGWAEVPGTGWNQGYHWYWDAPSDPAPSPIYGAYTCGSWGWIGSCNGDPNWPGCRGNCGPGQGPVNRTCTASATFSEIGKLIIN